MQQTKQTERACAGGEAPRHGAAARQVDAAVRPSTGVPRPSDAVSARAATSAVVLSQDSAGKAAGSGRKASVPTGGVGSSPTIPGLPPGGFATILVDPPWPAQSGEKHYRTMSLARITALPVGHLAARDAHLWLWTTNALLRTAYEVAEAWGFTVRSPLTWVKFRLGLGGAVTNCVTPPSSCCSAPEGRHPWVRALSRPGLTPPSPSTRASRLSSSPSSSGSALGRTWSCLPAGGQSRTSPGQCGETRWTPTSASPALPCRGTASGRVRQTPRHLPRQRSGRSRCRRRWLMRLAFLAWACPLLRRLTSPAVSTLQECAVAALVTTEMKPLTVTARR